ncbi:hypothetical protein EG832_13020 [bacterium]|nr:hypothetical protein [bacterium]
MKPITHTPKTFLLKLLAFWILFLIFHFLHEWIPVPFMVIFAGNSEGAVQHMKMAFWAFTFASLGEYFIRRVNNQQLQSFFDSRLLLTDLAPWTMFFWYILPVIFGKPFASEAVEILAANIVLVLMGVALLFLERDLSGIRLSRISRIILILFWILTAFLMVAVSFKIPWAGFFVA